VRPAAAVGVGEAAEVVGAADTEAVGAAVLVAVAVGMAVGADDTGEHEASRTAATRRALIREDYTRLYARNLSPTVGGICAWRN
jgi:hypothetical protein